MIGHLLYGLVALILLIDTVWQWHLHRRHQTKHGKLILDVIIMFGCIVSVVPTETQWSILEWLFRLGLCAVILLRIATLVLQHMQPSHLMQVIVLAIIMLSTAGAGF